MKTSSPPELGLIVSQLALGFWSFYLWIRLASRVSGYIPGDAILGFSANRAGVCRDASDKVCEICACVMHAHECVYSPSKYSEEWAVNRIWRIRVKRTRACVCDSVKLVGYYLVSVTIKSLKMTGFSNIWRMTYPRNEIVHDRNIAWYERFAIRLILFIMERRTWQRLYFWIPRGCCYTSSGLFSDILRRMQV